MDCSEWITEKIYTETELLYVITELYLQICGDFRYQEHIQSICKNGLMDRLQMEINNKETIGIAEVESLCNKRISYEMNFLYRQYLWSDRSWRRKWGVSWSRTSWHCYKKKVKYSVLIWQQFLFVRVF